MAFEGYHDAGTDLSALGGNLADLIVALAGTATSLVAGGMGFANPLMGGASSVSCRCGAAGVQYTLDGGIVRHHYRYCCVPPCYGCTRCCS